MAQAHITIEGVTLEALLLDKEAFMQEYVQKLSEEYKNKETSGLYRRLLVAQVCVCVRERERE